MRVNVLMVGVQTPVASSAVNLHAEAHEDNRGNPNGQPLDTPSDLCLEGSVWKGGAKMSRIVS